MSGLIERDLRVENLLDQVEELQEGVAILEREAVTSTVEGSDASVVYNVNDYGAMGDGAADDTEAVQATINAAGEDDQATVVFEPDGIYLLGKQASQKTFSIASGSGDYDYCIDVPSNVTLDLNGATLKLKTGVDAILLSNAVPNADTDTDIAILNGVIDGNSVANTEPLIWWHGVTRLTLDNIRIKDTNHIGMLANNV